MGDPDPDAASGFAAAAKMAGVIDMIAAMLACAGVMPEEQLPIARNDLAKLM